VPALAEVRPRERFIALAAVVLVQGGLILGLLSGLRVDVARTRDSVARLIDISLTQPPPRVIPPPKPVVRQRHEETAPKAQPAPLGGSPGPQPAHATTPAPAPIVAIRPAAPVSGGGTGAGPAVGSGTGGGTGGTGGNGDAGDDSGTESVQIAGEILPSDYPKELGKSGIGGHVGIDFVVGTTGRIARCRVTRSSGVPQLDALTCRLIVERFRFRPATDSRGRPVEDEIEGVHVWSVTGGY